MNIRALGLLNSKLPNTNLCSQVSNSDQRKNPRKKARNRWARIFRKSYNLPETTVGTGLMQAIQLDDTMQPASEEIRKAVKHLYSIAPQFKGIEKVAGPLTVRRGTPTFATLVRIVVGQQLAIKAAASIYARLNSTISLTPQAM